MDAQTMIGGGLVVLAGLAYSAPKIKTYLASKKTNSLPHEHVKSLIDYFSGKGCKKGVDASVTVGKLLYEECTEHLDEPQPEPKPNNLP